MMFNWVLSETEAKLRLVNAGKPGAFGSDAPSNESVSVTLSPTPAVGRSSVAVTVAAASAVGQARPKPMRARSARYVLSERAALPAHDPCSADILVCGFAGHSCPAFPAQRYGQATGKSP